MGENIGITLLIGEPKRSGKIRATLISLITSYSSKKMLLKDIDEMILKFGWEKYPAIGFKQIYFGIEDVFEVSGPLIDGCLVGKTDMHDVKKESAIKLVRSIEKYDIARLLSASEFIFQLVYFYDDKSKEKKRTISVSFYFSEIDFVAALTRLKSRNFSRLLKEKLLEFDNEISNTSKLQFLGIENVYPVSIFAKQFGGFEAFSRDFSNYDEILELLPNQSEILSWL
jgi:hypothetical protein